VWAQWLLLVLYAGVGIVNVARGVLGFVVGPVIAAEVPYLVLLSVINVAWGAAFLFVSVAHLVKADAFAPRVVLRVAMLHQATVWVIKLAGERASYARSLWPRDLVLTIAFVGTVLLLVRLAADRSFGRQRS
jgi:hypothetical protein